MNNYEDDKLNQFADTYIALREKENAKTCILKIAKTLTNKNITIHVDEMVDYLGNYIQPTGSVKASSLDRLLDEMEFLEKPKSNLGKLIWWEAIYYLSDKDEVDFIAVVNDIKRTFTDRKV